MDAFRQQEASQDQRNQEQARRMKQIKASRSASSKPSSSSSSSKPLHSPQSHAQPVHSPQNPPVSHSLLSGMESMFSEERTQPPPHAVLEDRSPAVSGMMPGGLARHGHGGYSGEGDVMRQGNLVHDDPTSSMAGVPHGVGHLPLPELSPPPYPQQPHFTQPDFPPYYPQQLQMRQHFYPQQHFGPSGGAYDQVSGAVMLH